MLTQPVFRSIAWTLLLALLAGCGKSRSSSGGSLTSQYRNALKIPNADRRARKLLKIANDQHKGKDSAGAKQSLKDATEACQEVSDPIRRSSVFTQLADTQAQIGNRREARDALKVASEAAAKIEGAEDRARALCRIATVLGRRLEKTAEATKDRALQTLKAGSRLRTSRLFSVTYTGMPSR